MKHSEEPAWTLTNPFELTEADGYSWLRGNLHSHSTNSDGWVSPQERVDRYVEAGYDFLCLSDHDRITRIDSVRPRDGITLIQGVEIHPDNPFGGRVYHFLAYGVTEDLDAKKMPPQHVIDAVHDQGGSIWLAHPYWSNISVLRDVAPLRGLAGIEIFNTVCERMARGESGSIWDEWMLHAATGVPAIANDDCHNNPIHGDDEFQGWTMVRAADRTPQSILTAIATGAAYTTTGPEIRGVTLQRSADPPHERYAIEATIRCSPVCGVKAICDGMGDDMPKGPHGPLFEEATLHLSNSSRWVRFEIVDERNRKAWTNPFDLRGLAHD